MIDPNDFIGKKKEKGYDSFKKLDLSYMCQHPECSKFSAMVYRDEENQLIIWKCTDGHENKARAFFQ